MDTDTESITSDACATKNLAKKTLIESAVTLKASSLDITLFITINPSYITNSIHRFLTKKDPNELFIRRSYIPHIGEIFESALAVTNKPKVGTEIVQDKSSIISEMTQLTDMVESTHKDTWVAKNNDPPLQL